MTNDKVFVLVNEIETFLAAMLCSAVLISTYPLEIIPVDAQPVIRDSNLRVEIISKGIKFPSNMAFLNPNDILVLEKNEGTVVRITDGHILPEPLLKVDVNISSERGMVGIAVADREQGPTYVFLYYTEGDDTDHKKAIEDSDVDGGVENIANRVYRYELVGNKLVNPRIVLDLPATPGPTHNGGEIIIGPDSNLYVVIGDVNRKSDTLAQNNIEGKEPDGRSAVLRITQEGKLVDSKGILGNDHPLDMYYAYGIRNSFGIDFDPLSGKLWDTENGPTFGDEINIVEPGFNSGWKMVQGMWQFKTGVSYSESKGEIVDDDMDLADELVNFNGNGKYSAPEFTWDSPSPGLTGMAFLDSKKLGSEYENDLFVGAFHTGHLYHFDLSQDRADLSLNGPLSDKIGSTAEENDLQQVIFGEKFGGITDVQTGPDGYLYILSLYQGGDNCRPDEELEDCVPYSGSVEGTIFRIAPRM